MADNSVNPAIAAILGIAGAGAGKYFGNKAAENAVPPQLQQLLQMSADRAAFQQPLAQAQTQGIYSMLPNFARQGTQLGGSIQGAAPQVGTGGGMSPALAAALGAGGMGVLDSLMGGGNGGAIPFDTIINALKKLFGGGGRDTVQGNQPNAGGTGFTNMGPTGFSGWDSSVSDPSGNPYLMSDPGSWWNDQGGATPTDPSGGSGVGPGMQQYRGMFPPLANPDEE